MLLNLFAIDARVFWKASNSLCDVLESDVASLPICLYIASSKD